MRERSRKGGLPFYDATSENLNIERREQQEKLEKEKIVCRYWDFSSDEIVQDFDEGKQYDLEELIEDCIYLGTYEENIFSEVVKPSGLDSRFVDGLKENALLEVAGESIEESEWYRFDGEEWKQIEVLASPHGKHSYWEKLEVDREYNKEVIEKFGRPVAGLSQEDLPELYLGLPEVNREDEPIKEVYGDAIIRFADGEIDQEVEVMGVSKDEQVKLSLDKALDDGYLSYGFEKDVHLKRYMEGQGELEKGNEPDGLQVKSIEEVEKFLSLYGFEGKEEDSRNYISEDELMKLRFEETLDLRERKEFLELKLDGAVDRGILEERQKDIVLDMYASGREDLSFDREISEDQQKLIDFVDANFSEYKIEKDRELEEAKLADRIDDISNAEISRKYTDYEDFSKWRNEQELDKSYELERDYEG